MTEPGGPSGPDYLNSPFQTPQYEQGEEALYAAYKLQTGGILFAAHHLGLPLPDFLPRDESGIPEPVLLAPLIDDEQYPFEDRQLLAAYNLISGIIFKSTHGLDEYLPSASEFNLEEKRDAVLTYALGVLDDDAEAEAFVAFTNDMLESFIDPIEFADKEARNTFLREETDRLEKKAEKYDRDNAWIVRIATDINEDFKTAAHLEAILTIARLAELSIEGLLEKPKHRIDELDVSRAIEAWEASTGERFARHIADRGLPPGKVIIYIPRFVNAALRQGLYEPATGIAK